MITMNQKSKAITELSETQRIWSDPNVSWQLYENDQEAVLLQRIRSRCIERDKILEQNRLIVENQLGDRKGGGDRESCLASAEYFPRKNDPPEEQRGVVFRDFTPLLLIEKRSDVIRDHPELSDLTLLQNERIEVELEVEKLVRDLKQTTGNDALNIEIRLKSARERLEALLDFLNAMSLLLYLSDILSELHESGRLHLEMNLMNVGITSKGLVRVLPSPPYHPNRSVRRRVWIDDLNGEDIVAPEIQNNDPVTPASDIYCAVQTFTRYLGMQRGRKLESGFDLANEEFLMSMFSRAENPARFRPVVGLLTGCASPDSTCKSARRFKADLKQCLNDPTRTRLSKNGPPVQIDEKDSKVNYKPFLILGLSLVLLIMIVLQMAVTNKSVAVPDSPQRESKGDVPQTTTDKAAVVESPPSNPLELPSADSHSNSGSGKDAAEDTAMETLPVLVTNRREDAKPKPDLSPAPAVHRGGEPALQKEPSSKEPPGSQTSHPSPPTASKNDNATKQAPTEMDPDAVFSLPSFEFCSPGTFCPPGMSDAAYEKYSRLLKSDIYIALKEADFKVSQKSLLDSYRQAKAICGNDFRLEILCGLVSERNGFPDVACKFYCQGHRLWKSSCQHDSVASQFLKKVSLPRRLWIREMIRFRTNHRGSTPKQTPRAIQELLQYFAQRDQYEDADPEDSIRFVLYMLSYIRADESDASVTTQCDMAIEKMRNMLVEERDHQLFACLLRKHDAILSRDGDTAGRGRRETVSDMNTKSEDSEDGPHNSFDYRETDDEFLYGNMLERTKVRKRTKRQQLSQIRRSNYVLIYELNYHLEFQSVLESYGSVQ